jgi:hypothetical protein
MGDVPEILQLLRFPATSAIIAANCTAHYVIRQRGLGYGDVGSSHRLVWKEGQWWRAVTASFSHISIIHLGFNMFSTWQLRGTEATLGSLLYLSVRVVLYPLPAAAALRPRPDERTRTNGEHHGSWIQLRRFRVDDLVESPDRAQDSGPFFCARAVLALAFRVSHHHAAHDPQRRPRRAPRGHHRGVLAGPGRLLSPECHALALCCRPQTAR